MEYDLVSINFSYGPLSIQTYADPFEPMSIVLQKRFLDATQGVIIALQDITENDKKFEGQDPATLKHEPFETSLNMDLHEALKEFFVYSMLLQK